MARHHHLIATLAALPPTPRETQDANFAVVYASPSPSYRLCRHLIVVLVTVDFQRRPPSEAQAAPVVGADPTPPPSADFHIVVCCLPLGQPWPTEERALHEFTPPTFHCCFIFGCLPSLASPAPAASGCHFASPPLHCPHALPAPKPRQARSSISVLLLPRRPPAFPSLTPPLQSQF